MCRCTLRRLSLLLFLALLLPTSSACERSSSAPASTEEVLPSACYHFTVQGAFEYSATCEDYRVSPASERFLRVILMHPPVALSLEVPRETEPGQYRIGSPGSDETAAVGAYLLLTPLDSPEQRYDRELTGTLTVLSNDDAGITALFDFRAESAMGDAVEVRGHLRELR